MALTGRPTLPSRTPEILLATWFAAITAQRLAVLIPAQGFGFDGRLYREAALTWLSGGDPWSVSLAGVRFAAPPPSLLAMVPFAVLPEPLAVVALVAAGLAGMVFVLRRLGLPAWFLLFPPFVDGLWNANPDILLLPLLLSGTGTTVVSAFVKVYALVPPVVLGRWRSVGFAAIALALTAPLLPWGLFVERLPEIGALLVAQSSGGMSATAWPPAVPVAVIALVFAGRERAAWLAVPALWPATQWYYATIAVPALVGRTPAAYLAAAIFAVPIPGLPVLAVVLIAIERRASRISRVPRRGQGSRNAG